MIREPVRQGRRNRYVRKMADGREAPFLLYSKGIGRAWLNTIDAVTARREGYVVLDGIKFAVPKYYQNKWDEKKSVYDREVDRLLRKRWRFEQLKESHYIRSWFDFDRYVELSKQVHGEYWAARDADRERNIRKLRQRVSTYANKLMDIAFIFGESFTDLDDFLLHHSRCQCFHNNDLIILGKFLFNLRIY